MKRMKEKVVKYGMISVGLIEKKKKTSKSKLEDRISPGGEGKQAA